MSFRRSPLWFRALNNCWRSVYFAGTKIHLDKDGLIRAAMSKTGFKDLGKDFDDGPLDKLLWSIEHEAELHPVGRFITKERFTSLIGIRLRAEAYFRRYPQILEQELYPAWFIVGLQRTGTTKLQRLLAQDPDHRVIPSWEVINPVPLNPGLYDFNTMHPGGEGTGSNTYPHPRDKRIQAARTAIQALKYMSPDFFAVHPIDILQPEEDILLLDLSFMSTTPEAMMHVPTYAGWLEQTDQSAGYAYAVKILKFLQWIRPAKRWVLKSPHHLEFPALIARHFGEVHFLWSHRVLYECVPSFLSMVTYNRMVFSDQVDEREVARHWVRKIGYMTEQALSYRLLPGNDARFTDIAYKELVTNSERELQRIYSLNGGVTEELFQRFRQHEKEHPHQKHGVHQYSLADFGLTPADIDRQTGQYRAFFHDHYEHIQAEKIQ